MSRKEKKPRRRVRRVADLVGEERKPIEIKPRIASLKKIESANKGTSVITALPSEHAQKNPELSSKEIIHNPTGTATLLQQKPIAHSKPLNQAGSNAQPPPQPTRSVPVDKKVSSIKLSSPENSEPAPGLPPLPQNDTSENSQLLRSPSPYPHCEKPLSQSYPQSPTATEPSTQDNIQAPRHISSQNPLSPLSRTTITQPTPGNYPPDSDLPSSAEPQLEKSAHRRIKSPAPSTSKTPPTSPAPDWLPMHISPVAIFSAGALLGAMLVGLIWLASFAWKAPHATKTSPASSLSSSSSVKQDQLPSSLPSTGDLTQLGQAANIAPAPDIIDASVATQLVKSWFALRTAPSDETSAASESADFLRFLQREPSLLPNAVLAVFDIAIKRYEVSPPVARGALPALDSLFQQAAQSSLTNLQAATLHHTYGCYLALAGESSRAENSLRSALTFFPGFIPAQRELFDLARLRDNLPLQIEMGSLLAATNSDDHAMIAEVARLLDLDGKTGEAVAFLAKYPNAVVSLPTLAIFQAQLLKKNGASPDEIIKALDPAVKKHPDDLSLSTFRLILLDMAGYENELMQALPLCISKLNLDEVSTDTKTARHALALASLAWKHGKRKEADSLYNALVASRTPLAPTAANDLAYKLIEANDNFDQAERLALQALEAQPNELSHIDTLATLHLKRGRPDLAIQTFQDRINIDNLDHPIACETLAKALDQVGRKEEAEALRARAHP